MAKPILMFISSTTLLALPLALSFALSLGAAAPAVASEEVFTDAQWGQTAGSKSATPTASPVESSLLAIGGSLLLVIALAVVLGWLVKRLGVKRFVQAKGRYIEVIDSVPLGFKRQASLVRIGDIVVLVGVGEHELTTLATLPASTVLSEAMTTSKAASAIVAEVPAVSQAAPPDPAFRSLLAKVIKG